MSLIPNTTCQRCHRQYPSFRSNCPYCGTKKAKEVRSPVPETDSVVPGTKAAKSAAETVNWQMLIGSVLLVAVFLVTVILVSVSVSNHIEEPLADGPGNAGQGEDAGTVPQFTTAEPIVETPEPTPSPSPEVVFTDVRVTWSGNPTISNYIPSGFPSGVGYHYDMQLSFYPFIADATIEWKSSDESAVTVNNGSIDIIGGSGSTVTISIYINGKEVGSFPITIT